MLRLRTLLLSAFLLLFLTVLALYYCNHVVEEAAKGKLYHQTDATPYNKIGLLLGTSKYLVDNSINPYYQNRINAAVDLIKAGKVKYIIVSGDNSRKEYNEPQMMKEDLIKAGVDSTSILLDYAGLRTFDSIIRLRENFSQQTATIISQQFHNERALYIAGREGITAIGFNAEDVHSSMERRQNIRERLARVKVFLDYLIGKDPKFLGDKIHIPE